MTKKLPAFLLLLALPLTAGAGLTIEQLIEQARLVESEAPINKPARWQGASKVVIWDRGFDLGAIGDEVEIVRVRSAEEALQHVADADPPLWSYDNVVITPHVAGAGGENERHNLLLLENLRRYVPGDRLLNVVDPQKGY